MIPERDMVLKDVYSKVLRFIYERNMMASSGHKVFVDEDVLLKKLDSYISHTSRYR